MKRSPPVTPAETAAAKASDSDRCVHIDAPTLITISAPAWATANVFHEIVGHAGAAVALGIPVRAVSTTTPYADWTALESAAQHRIINAAATPVNVLSSRTARLRAIRPPQNALC